MPILRRFQRYLLLFFFMLLIIIALSSKYDWPPEGQAPFTQTKTGVQPGTAASTPQKQPVDNSPLSKWGSLPRNYPVKSLKELPSSVPRDIPRIQYNFRRETPEERRAREDRLWAVREAFEHAWKGYKEYAWMKDEVRPLSGGNTDTFGGWAATLVDSLDTLWIMGFDEDFQEAVQAVDKIDFTTCALEMLNTFETTIRYMGGFLAAYDLSGQPILLTKAKELGELIYKAFDTPNHMPIARWNWTQALAGVKQEAQASTLVAEIGSLSLELTRLSQLTGDPRYFDAISRVTDMLKDQQDKTLLPGMWPIVGNAQEMSFMEGRDFTLGGMADSVFEYLPKEYLLLGGHDDDYRAMYEKAITAAKEKLFFRPMLPGDPDILVSGSYHVATEKVTPMGQHLVCFVGGMMAIASKIFNLEDDIEAARRITDGCVWAYGATETGIMPELFTVIPCEDASDCTFDELKWTQQSFSDSSLPKGIIGSGDHEYKLRPEAIESVWIMYRITGDPAWMDKGWTMFQAVEKATRTPIAHATVKDVFGRGKSVDGLQSDKMESFWTAETLKYYFLLFSEPSVISLDEYVLNTEAHPLKRPVKGGWW